MQVEEIKAELGEYVHKNSSVISAGVYSEEVTLDKYCRRLSSIKGKYPQFHQVMTNVVQGFKAEWQELGQAQFKANILQNYRQKVNFPVIVDDVYGTWLTDLKIEGKTPQEQPIAKYIMDDLNAKIIDDLDELSITAVRDDDNADGQFGKSLDGIQSVVSKGVANVKHPMFTIPLSALTPANILDQFKAFEKGVPRKVRKKIGQVFVSEDVALMYQDAYAEAFGTHTTHSDDRTKKTHYYKWDIVPLPELADTVVFTTVKNNMVKLIDIIDNPPRVTDIQIQDYKMKIFMEFHLGYSFIINQLVFVADFGANPRGLRNAEQNALYYKTENLTV